MADRHRGGRGRTMMAAAAAVLVAAAVILGALGWRAQVHAATPPASAAHPAAEGNLPAPPATHTHSGGRAGTAGQATTAPAPAPSAPPVVGPVLARSKPVFLSIPAIGIHHTRLAAYGTDAQGAVAMPPATGGVPAGWYTGSPTPGQLGPAVIVGHTDAEKNGASIFFRLGQLRPGDTVRVTLADHVVATFRVDSLEHYPKANFPTQKVYGNINHAGLRLISCIGHFDAATGHYLDNIVVYAHLVASHHE